ncbi:MAG: pyruvate synthase subunit beta [Clostridiales Family XIII bacterium]|jgi:pyruvate ferredoxin oxidoreductase beta subunit|nr:pyruvate synthase subunit beta [Clostridiales Family XIII bacterium]
MRDILPVNVKALPEEEFFFGHRACGGCGGSIVVRLTLKVLGPHTFVVVPANCMSAVSFYYPTMNFSVNALAGVFSATGAILSGIEAAADAQGLKDYTVVGFAGDGGTADIGLQALSGAIDRNDRIIYICYDNEAYMNTGVQESGLTPLGAKTTTSPIGENMQGKITHKKNMFEIVAAHNIGYAATASVGYPRDFINKINKAKHHRGTSYIHVIAPCPTGWSMESDATASIAREAVDCGLWYLAEFENGGYKLNKTPNTFGPIKEYLKKQGRFKHLSDEKIGIVEQQRDAMWKRMKEWR